MTDDFNDKVRRAMEQERHRDKDKLEASEDTKRKGRDLVLKLDEREKKKDQ